MRGVKKFFPRIDFLGLKPNPTKSIIYSLDEMQGLPELKFTKFTKSYQNNSSLGAALQE
jgi:hypothetical protein